MNTGQFLLIFNSFFIMVCVWMISNSGCLDETTNVLYSVKEKFEYKILTKSNAKDENIPVKVEPEDNEVTSKPLPKCSNEIKDLKLEGPLKIEFVGDPPTFSELETKYPEVKQGGFYQPSDCIAQHWNAIIVPYRNRECHLRWFLEYIHPILMRQKIAYQIYVINQVEDSSPFNRAKLLNVGYVESLHDHRWQCFTFHDVDEIPENDRILYTCPRQPRHLARSVSNFNYRLPYSFFFGGVSQLSKEHFVKVNGFPNRYWGWGGEDDDMSKRVTGSGLKITRYPVDIARYKMHKHKRDKGNKDNPQRFNLLNDWRKHKDTDGLNSLVYKVLEVNKHHLYTNITVDVMYTQR